MSFSHLILEKGTKINVSWNSNDFNSLKSGAKATTTFGFIGSSAVQEKATHKYAFRLLKYNIGKYLIFISSFCYQHMIRVSSPVISSEKNFSFGTNTIINKLANRTIRELFSSFFWRANSQ